MALSKKKLKAIEQSSVMGNVIRELVEPYYAEGKGLEGKHFMDDEPSEWIDSDKLIFDVATEVEMRLKREIMRILDPTSGEDDEDQETESNA